MGRKGKSKNKEAADQKPTSIPFVNERATKNNEGNAWANGNTIERITQTQEEFSDDLEDVQLDSYLKSVGLVRKHTPKDGACLFRAVSEHIYSTQILHELVRKNCVDYLEANYAEYKPFICTNGIPYSHYLSRLRKWDTWGGEVELNSLSKFYGVGFSIYQIVGGEGHERTIGSENKVCYGLSFSHGNHYDVVYPEEHLKSIGFCQALVFEMVDVATGGTGGEGKGKYEFKNVEMERWLRGVGKAQRMDELLARSMEQQESGSIYQKERSEEGEWHQVSKRGKSKTKPQPTSNGRGKNAPRFRGTRQNKYPKNRNKLPSKLLSEREKQSLKEAQTLADQLVIENFEQERARNLHSSSFPKLGGGTTQNGVAAVHKRKAKKAGINSAATVQNLVVSDAEKNAMKRPNNSNDCNTNTDNSGNNKSNNKNKNGKSDVKHQRTKQNNSPSEKGNSKDNRDAHKETTANANSTTQTKQNQPTEDQETKIEHKQSPLETNQSKLWTSLFTNTKPASTQSIVKEPPKPTQQKEHMNQQKEKITKEEENSKNRHKEKEHSVAQKAPSQLTTNNWLNAAKQNANGRKGQSIANGTTKNVTQAKTQKQVDPTTKETKDSSKVAISFSHDLFNGVLGDGKVCFGDFNGKAKRGKKQSNNKKQHNKNKNKRESGSNSNKRETTTDVESKTSALKTEQIKNSNTGDHSDLEVVTQTTTIKAVAESVQERPVSNNNEKEKPEKKTVSPAAEQPNPEKTKQTQNEKEENEVQKQHVLTQHSKLTEGHLTDGVTVPTEHQPSKKEKCINFGSKEFSLVCLEEGIHSLDLSSFPPIRFGSFDPPSSSHPNSTDNASSVLCNNNDPKDFHDDGHQPRALPQMEFHQQQQLHKHHPQPQQHPPQQQAQQQHVRSAGKRGTGGFVNSQMLAGKAGKIGMAHPYQQHMVPLSHHQQQPYQSPVFYPPTHYSYPPHSPHSPPPLNYTPSYAPQPSSYTPTNPSQQFYHQAAPYYPPYTHQTYPPPAAPFSHSFSDYQYDPYLYSHVPQQQVPQLSSVPVPHQQLAQRHASNNANNVSPTPTSPTELDLNEE
eukprot:CAMPEP_0174250144 /NCGR_PEP_ID=MMETSP0439-20130205/406_1 /TAXON_ID=0 /ORGANISM="Stereomyxa ramosa, Strain Chinc5" /LENGTH=1068 /DNA_ID=CAMNT_0015330137 /DNA_START=19 /DNA_END=3225 /DNA_ORIENTATION=+